VAADGTLGSWCGNGGTCTPYGYSSSDGKGPRVSWGCDRGCGAGWDAGCRSGYVCDARAQPMAGPALCVPDCRNPGAVCPSGTSCVAGFCL
jgi:hypothetical protein